MKLIIAEKPSLAKNIVAGIGQSSFTRNDGYYENGQYVVTWAFGHLFGLIDIEEYDSDYNPEEKHSWSMDNLPFVPDRFRFSLKKDAKTKKTDAGVSKQFKIIKTLMNRSDIDTIINAGDSDREGEIIIRLILMNAGNKKPVERLWLPDQTPETIKAQLGDIESDKKYDNLANEGYARTFIDWLYGINLTRYGTLKSNTLLRVGRVITEIVNAVYERDMTIKSFVPEKYFSITSKEKTNGEEVELTSKKEFKLEENNNAQELCDKYNAVDAIVTDANKERKIIGAGKLYSLSKLEGVLGKKYKMGLQKSLDIVQKLYEGGYVTYPRTNTEYMATAEKGKVQSIIKVLSGEGFPLEFKDTKSIFDDSKIESHSALTPTTKIPKEGVLTKEEQEVYDTIRNRFIAVFCSEPCTVDRSTIVISVGEYENFTLKGDIMIDKGWTAYDFYEKKDKTLPKLEKGDRVITNFKPAEKETKPPKHYTTDTLNKYLKNPFKKEKEDADENDDEEYKAILDGLEIGTEATRPAIIGNAINSGYISLKNDTYYIQDAGVYYIETLKALKIYMDKTKTVELSKALKSVYKGNMSIMQSVKVAEDEICEIFSHKDIVIEQGTAFGDGVIGKCPLCGGSIKKQSWGYGCSGYKNGCKFSVNGSIAGKKITEANVKALLEKGITGQIKGFTNKAGKKFDAKLKMDNGKVAFAFDEPPKHEEKISFKCPKCGGEIENGKWGWTCKSGCGFSVNYQIAGKKLSEKDVNTLLEDGIVGPIKGFKNKTGNLFNAKLSFDENYKVIFRFN